MPESPSLFHALSPGDPRHGTMNGYKNLGCRCDECCQAHTDWTRINRHISGYHRPRDEYLAEMAEIHGASRYHKGGCRCDVCRAAVAEEKRLYRARHPEVRARESAQRMERSRAARRRAE